MAQIKSITEVQLSKVTKLMASSGVIKMVKVYIAIKESLELATKWLVGTVIKV